MSEPLTAQLITNSTSERVEQVADPEALRGTSGSREMVANLNPKPNPHPNPDPDPNQVRVARREMVGGGASRRGREEQLAQEAGEAALAEAVSSSTVRSYGARSSSWWTSTFRPSRPTRRRRMRR